MQHLATKNVGYGQMGNMSVTIYDNDNDKILIGSDYAEDYISGEYGDEYIEPYKEFQKELDENNLKEIKVE